jgi:uncharacterized membrane protein
MIVDSLPGSVRSLPVFTADSLLADGVLAVHILAGVVALLAGLAAIATTKGGAKHNRAGRGYVTAMAVVVATAVPLSVWIENWFLLAVAVFSGYLVFAGARIVERRRSGLTAPTPRDYLLHGTMLAAGAVMIAVGGGQSAIGDPGLAPVLAVFGTIGLALAVRELAGFRTAPAERTPWFERHIAYMGGGYIATVTATVTVNLTMVPPLVRWLGPTAIGVPLIFYGIRTYRPVFGRAAA